jgi:hypothetical protein
MAPAVQAAKVLHEIPRSHLWGFRANRKLVIVFTLLEVPNAATEDSMQRILSRSGYFAAMACYAP